MAPSSRINATHFRTGTNEWNEGVAIGKEPTFQRAKVKNNSFTWNVTVTIGIDDGVDREGVGGIINVAKDQKGVSEVA